jgi:hypothetical protein
MFQMSPTQSESDMAVAILSPTRRSVVPAGGDTWADIAARALPGTPQAEAVAQLQSWNLHVFMRAASRLNGRANPILPSDVIFVEPPLTP